MLCRIINNPKITPAMAKTITSNSMRPCSNGDRVITSSVWTDRQVTSLFQRHPTSKNTLAPSCLPAKCSFFKGADGIRTCDLRRDRPVGLLVINGFSEMGVTNADKCGEIAAPVAPSGFLSTDHPHRNATSDERSQQSDDRRNNDAG
jgi:hypothetical protein